MGKPKATVVREGLQAYSDRGVFRSFTEKAGKDGKIKFQFLYFGDKPVNLEFEEKDHTLVVRNMLRRVPADMYRDFTAFLDELYDPHLPAHRRIHKGSAEAEFVKKGSNVSLVFRVKRNRYKYGVNKLVNLLSWIHTHVQNYHPDYLVEVLGEPEE
jgi:hemerythrin